jgi:hypothetical protein
MILSLRGLAAYQVEAFARSVESEMERLGYDARMKDEEGPEVEVCMATAGKPELCTRLVESGQPWAVYSPSNIANIQAERYKLMYLGTSLPGEKPPSREGRSRIAYYPASLSFVNTTTGDSSTVYVGDSWVLEVTGDPNAEVLSSGSGAYGSWTGTSHGRTNSQGILRLTGSMSTAEIGRWSQTWTVGGKRAGTLSFEVKARPVQQEQKSEQRSSDSADEVQEKILERNGLSTTEGLMDWAQANPLLLAGGAVALFLLLGRGK